MSTVTRVVDELPILPEHLGSSSTNGIPSAAPGIILHELSTLPQHLGSSSTNSLPFRSTWDHPPRTAYPSVGPGIILHELTTLPEHLGSSRLFLIFNIMFNILDFLCCFSYAVSFRLCVCLTLELRLVIASKKCELFVKNSKNIPAYILV